MLVVFEVPGDQVPSFGDDVFIAAAAFEPVHVGFATEPCKLALRVVSVTLLGLHDGLRAGDFVLKDDSGFGVAERVEWTTIGTVACDKALRLFDEAAVEHRGRTLVDAFIEAGAWWIEAEIENAISGEGVAALLPLLRKGLIGGDGDFDGADDFGDIVDMDGRGCGGVEAGEHAVQIGGAASGGELAEAFALAGLLGRCREEAVDEGA